MSKIFCCVFVSFTALLFGCSRWEESCIVRVTGEYLVSLGEDVPLTKGCWLTYRAHHADTYVLEIARPKGNIIRVAEVKVQELVPACDDVDTDELMHGDRSFDRTPGKPGILPFGLYIDRVDHNKVHIRVMGR